MCKQLRGLRKETTNIGVLLELGRLPLNISTIKASIKNWERIRGGGANTLLNASYEDSMAHSLSWTMSIKKTLEINGMLDLFINVHRHKTPLVVKCIYQRLSDNFYQTSFEAINKNTSKLRTYALFKHASGCEKYLTVTKNVSVRTLVTKFRLSNHGLMIEIGRHNGTPKEARFCPFCSTEIETEFHFLWDCPTYSYLRNRFLSPTSRAFPGFNYLTNEMKIKLILSNMDENTCNYIAKASELRTFLIKNPKRTS